MMGWTEYTLEEVVTVLGDGLHGTPKYSENGDYYFVNGSNLLNGKIIITPTTKRTTESEYLKYKKNLNERTILLSINGTLGNIGTYNNEKIVLGKSACYFNVRENFDKDFIKYVVSAPNFRNFLTEYAHGTTIRNVSLKVLRNYRFKAPEIANQVAISKILSALDEKIEQNNAINKNLEDLAQALFKHWFVDFEFPNENGEPYKSSGGEMVESELGEIPKSWLVSTVADVTEVVTKGTTPTTIGGRFCNHGINFIKVESISENGEFNKEKFSFIDEETNLLLKRSVIKEGDVLFSIAGTIGRVAVATKSILPANTNQAIAIIRPSKMDSYFLKLLMRSSLVQQDTQSNIVQAVQANLSLAVIKKTKFILPDKHVLNLFKEATSALFRSVEENLVENENLYQLRDCILPKLMTGELAVQEAEQLTQSPELA